MQNIFLILTFIELQLVHVQKYIPLSWLPYRQKGTNKRAYENKCKSLSCHYLIGVTVKPNGCAVLITVH